MSIYRDQLKEMAERLYCVLEGLKEESHYDRILGPIADMIKDDYIGYSLDEIDGRAWIGVDLDGTLAHYDTWKGPDHIGEPIPKMLEFTKGLIEQGHTVKIFTARMAAEIFHEITTKAVQDWCEKHGLPRLEVTCVKDGCMKTLYDDRAVQVVYNTGQRIVSPSRPQFKGGSAI